MPQPSSEIDTDAEPTASGRDGQGGDAATTPTTETADSGAGSNNDNKTPSELEQLRAQLKLANDESATRRHRIKELEDQIKKQERAEMDELERLQAELKDLTGADGERDQLKTELEQYQTAVQSQVDALKKQLKLADHVSVLLEGMTPAKQLAYLVEHGSSLAPDQPRKPEFDSDKKSRKSAADKTKDKEARKATLAQRMRLNRR